MIIYLKEEHIIYYNQKVLKEIIKKKADKHEVINIGAISNALDKTFKAKGDVYKKAAVLLLNLVKGHGFASGNRRTAYMTTRIFLQINGEKILASNDETVLQGVREGFYSITELKNWLMGNEIKTFHR